MLLTIGATVLVLGVLIFVHELGHFLAAKSVGIAVLRFSFGLGSPTPLSIRRGETEYCVSWIPFGGYVKMAGHEDDESGGMEGKAPDIEVPKERTFDAKPLWARTFVISAGVIMNVVFAVLVYAVLAGIFGVARDPSTVVDSVRTDSLPLGAAPLATIAPGERIVRVGGDSVKSWGDMMDRLLTAKAPIAVEIAGRSAPLMVDVPLRDQAGRLHIAEALVPRHEPVIGEVVPGYPAAGAGLQVGDRVLRAAGDSVVSWERLVQAVERSANMPLELVLLRGGQRVTTTLTPRPTTIGQGAAQRTVGRVGVAPLLPVTRPGPLGALVEGGRRAASSVGFVLFTLKGLILGQVSVRDVGGPILIGQMSGEAARQGWDYLLGFMALLSVNLAVLNLLPIPVLDGGHLVFLAVEGVRRRPLSLAQRQRLTQVGFAVLVGIMLLALANDLQRVLARYF